MTTAQNPPRVFISYSHDTPEHAGHVLALSARLRADGIETILDQYNPTPEEGWPRWMARHIRDADFVLLVCTERYYRRVMGDEKEGLGYGVRWEGHLVFQYIYDAGTRNSRFLPVVLHAADRAFIPDPLRGYSFFDVGNEGGYTELYRILTGQLPVKTPIVARLKTLPVPARQWDERPPTPLVRVPRVPVHYIERPEFFLRLKQKLMSEKSDRVAVTSGGQQVGLHGMAGIGKSVLAAAVCRDQAVAQRYSDGIIWLTLGESPNIERRQIDLYECFVESPAEFKDVDSGRIALSRILRDKRCLIVLDDVWNLADARAFDVIGDKGALLVTTRDAGLARGLDLEDIPLGLMDELSARALLAATSGRGTHELTPEAIRVIEECGRLPLAIAMMGGMVHGLKDPWRDALERLSRYQLDRIEQEFPDYPYPNLLRAMSTSTDALPPKLMAHYGKLAVFPEDVHIPAAVLKTFWASIDVDDLEIGVMLRQLTEKSLLFRDEHERVFLHDIQRAFLIRRATDLGNMHRDLVRRYNLQCSDGWASGPDDGYFFQNLVYHLVQGGQTDTALGLIAEFRWLSVQLSTHGLLAVLKDCDIVVSGREVAEERREVARSIRDTVRLAGHRLEREPSHLAEQLYGRLANDTSPVVKSLLDFARKAKDGVWLKPLFASLGRPGGPLLRTISVDAPPEAVIPLRDGRVLCAVAERLLAYDLASGVLLGEFIHSKAKISHAAISSDGTLVLCAFQDGAVSLVSVQDGVVLNTKVIPQPERTEWIHRTNDDEHPDYPLQYIAQLAAIPGTNSFVGAIVDREVRYQGRENEYPPIGLWLIQGQDLSFTPIPVGHARDVKAVGVTPCGTCIVSGSDDGLIRIWNLRTNCLVRTLELIPERWAYAAKVGAVLITPDNQELIASSSWSGPIKRWKLDKDEPAAELGGHSDFSVAMALIDQGKRLAVGGHLSWIESIDNIHVYRYPNIRIWDLATGEMQRELKDHHDHITALAANSDGKVIVSGSADKTVRVWSVDPYAFSQAEQSFQFDKKISRVQIHGSGKWVVATDGRSVASIDTANGRRVASYEALTEDGEIEGVCLSRDGNVLIAWGHGVPNAVADREGNEAEPRSTAIVAYDFLTGKVLRTFQATREVDKQVAYFQGLRATPDGRYAFIVGHCYAEVKDGGFINQSIVVWKLETGEIVRVLYVPTPNHPKPAIEDWPTAISSDSRYFALTTVEENFRLCRIDQDFEITSFGDHKGWIGGIAFLPRAGLIITAGGNDETICVSNLITGELAWVWKNQGRIYDLGASPSETYVVVGTDGGDVRVLCIATRAVAASFQLDAPATSVDVHPSEPLIAAGDETGRVHVFKVENCKDW